MRRAVIAVPGLVDRQIGQPEVGAEIEDGEPLLPQRIDRGSARPVGQRAEGDVGTLGDRRGVEGLDLALEDAGEGRQHLGDRLTRRRVAGDVADREARMAMEETEELGTGVAGGPDDGGADEGVGHGIREV